MDFNNKCYCGITSICLDKNVRGWRPPCFKMGKIASGLQAMYSDRELIS